jgi:DtxR family Mn-dependent transcriptional regulator
MHGHDIARTERMEMYLKAVYQLLSGGMHPTVSRVADYLGLSAASASEMLKRLEHQKYIMSDKDGWHLSKQGLKIANQVVRRLRLAECMLVGKLKLPLPHAYTEACKWEHVIGPEVEEQMMSYLGRPQTCPHGFPIPYDDAVVPAESPKCLHEANDGQQVTVARIPEADEKLVSYLEGIGVLPGVTLTVKSIGPFKGPIMFSSKTGDHAIGQELAAQIVIQ